MNQAILGQRFSEALVYTAELHRDQRRKVSGTPYIAHLLSVAALVLEDGGTEDEAIAALLHDAVEDQGGAAIRGEIQQRFGDRVLHIVDACTESDQIPKPPWTQRKLQALTQMRQAPPEVQRVMVADKLHNLRSLWTDWQRQGDRIWDRFNASQSEILWFYGACIDAVRDRFDSPMVTELQTILNDLKL